MEWAEESLLWYRNSQMTTIVGGLAGVLNGTCSTFEANKNVAPDLPPFVGPQYLFWSSRELTCDGTGSPLVPFTSISDDFQKWDLGTYAPNTSPPPINLTITTEKINKLLGDYVISIIPSFGIWNQTANVTQFPSYNVYSFSRQQHLILPYSLCLLLTLPFMILGIHALHKNGVPAADGGFIQVLSTTTGSQTLQNMAAANCLGGDAASKDLADLKIKYGELINVGAFVKGTMVRRAGFGTEDEVVPLKKGEKYGVVGPL